VNALRPAPGSTLWLLLHELQLNLRGVTAARGAKVRLIVLGAILTIGTFAGGVPLALMLRRFPIEPNGFLDLSFDLAVVMIFTLILSQTLSATVLTFFERGDLELLLSSPMPPRRALAVKAVGVAMTPFLWFALFLTPVAAPMALLGQPRWLADYLVLASISLLASAAGVSLAMALFRLIGARRTRSVGQLLAALIGAVFFLVSQARTFMPDGGHAAIGRMARLIQSGAFDPGAPLSWPARAVMGEPIPLVVFVGVSLLVFAGATAALGRRFSTDVSAAAGAGAGTGRAARGAVTVKSFSTGVFPAMVRKELRLLVRDPTLLSQVLLRTLYVVPLTFVMIRGAGHSHGRTGELFSAMRLASLAGAVTFMAGQVAGSLAWITISAEDAPELLACAPVDGGLVRRAKLSATMIPVAVLLAAPLAALIWLAPWIGACATLGAAASAASAGLLNLWFEKTAPRKAFRNRRGGSVIGAVAEIVVGLGWAITAGVAAAGSPWALIPAAATLVALGVLYGLAAPDRAY
jgi:ABC-2 type transport system permease protein